MKLLSRTKNVLISLGKWRLKFQNIPMLEAAPAHVAKSWSVQEAMSAMEPHTFSICTNRWEDAETTGLSTSHRHPQLLINWRRSQ
ncbi:hypothetical protein E2C01_031684 [Portunus trituberculatus]|uniref:Uncharacterized protein n=1 Tax=Portunus trituberculatus TaxID=210409 RepID=A0A5B7EYS6_PORTR|nr:hypothetical protein [Portunus trituberculatus]